MIIELELNLIEINHKNSRVEAFPMDTSQSEKVHAVLLEVGSSMSDIVLSL
jgi:hypothetical protein